MLLHFEVGSTCIYHADIYHEIFYIPANYLQYIYTLFIFFLWNNGCITYLYSLNIRKQYSFVRREYFQICSFMIHNPKFIAIISFRYQCRSMKFKMKMFARFNKVEYCEDCVMILFYHWCVYMWEKEREAWKKGFQLHWYMIIGMYTFMRFLKWWNLN